MVIHDGMFIHAGIMNRDIQNDLYNALIELHTTGWGRIIISFPSFYILQLIWFFKLMEGYVFVKKIKKIKKYLYTKTTWWGNIIKSLQIYHVLTLDNPPFSRPCLRINDHGQKNLHSLQRKTVTSMIIYIIQTLRGMW